MKKFNCINDDLSHKDNEGLVENKVFPRKFHCVICLDNLLIQRTVMSTVISIYGHCRTVISIKREPNFQPNKIRGQHIVLFDSFMKTSSQTKVNLKYKFYTSSTFLFCTKLCVRAIRTLISQTNGWLMTK